MKYSDYNTFNNEKIKCRNCPIGPVYDKVVPSDGNTSNPKVLIIGEAPGADEITTGKPFVGKSGKLLRDELNRAGFRRSNSLITNVIPCRPLNNKFPPDDSIPRNCRDRWLWEEIRLTKPEYILLIGGQALKFVCLITGITKERGKPQQITIDERNIQCIATFHPSYILRKQHMTGGDILKKQFSDDIHRVAKMAGF